jgi:hypothetical protein
MTTVMMPLGRLMMQGAVMATWVIRSQQLKGNRNMHSHSSVWDKHRTFSTLTRFWRTFSTLTVESFHDYVDVFR